MEVCRNNSIQFNGTHVLKTNVLKKIGQEIKNFAPTEANIVELDYNLANDKKVAEELFRTWQGAEFIPMITSSTTSPSRRIYAITSQTSDYENLDPSKIMGVADFYLKGSCAHTNFLQAKPEIINKPERDIKGVGKALMQGIISHLKPLGYDNMTVFVRQSEKPFYRNIFPAIEDKLSTAEDSSNMFLRF